MVCDGRLVVILGDVTPRSTAGRLIGSIVMIGGILVLAFPISVLGTSFSNVVCYVVVCDI